MFSVTSSYRRKDGSRARQYVCRGYHFSDGTCDLRVDAEAVDAAVLERLPRIMPRFDQWIGQIEDRHAAERKRLEDDCDRARAERDRLARRLAKCQATWAELDPDDQRVALGAVRLAEQELARSEVRVQATEDAVTSVPEEVERDRLLDFAVNLRQEIAGRVEGRHSVEQLNRTLVELFSCFKVFRELPEVKYRGLSAETRRRLDEEDESLDADGPFVLPRLRWEVVKRLIDRDDPSLYEDQEAPLDWIQAFAPEGSAVSGYSQETWHPGPGRLLPSA